MSFGYQVLGFGAFPSREKGYCPAAAVYFDGAADYMTWTPLQAGSSNRKCTISFWVKDTMTGFGASSPVLVAGPHNTNYAGVFITSAERWLSERYNSSDGTDAWNEQVNGFSRDISAWRHIVVSHDHTDGTAGDRVKIFINGVLEAAQGSPTNPGTSQDLTLGSNTLHSICKLGSTGVYFSGWLADIIYLDGQSIEAGDVAIGDFGETDASTGMWVPKNPADAGFTFGTNGFWLPFNDSENIGADGNTGNTKGLQLNGGLTSNYSPGTVTGFAQFDCGTGVNSGNGPYSVALWATPTSLGSNDGIFQLGGNFTSTDSGSLRIAASTGSISWCRAGVGNLTSTTTPLSAGTESFIGLTHTGTGNFNSTNTKIYHNGTSQGLSTDSFAQSTLTTFGAIGMQTGGTSRQDFTGRIRHFMVWNEVLDADEMLSLYNSGTPISPESNTGNYDSSTGLVHYFPMTEDSGIYLEDKKNTKRAWIQEHIGDAAGTSTGTAKTRNSFTPYSVGQENKAVDGPNNVSTHSFTKYVAWGHGSGTLTNNNLTLAGGGSYDMRVSNMRLNHLAYWEVRCDARSAPTSDGDRTWAGVGSTGIPAFTGTNAHLTSTNVKIWGVDNAWQPYADGTSSGTAGTDAASDSGWDVGEVACFAIRTDGTDSDLWIGADQSTAWIGGGNPATGTTPTLTISSKTADQLYAAIGSYSSTDQLTGLFVENSWHHSPPSGFSAITADTYTGIGNSLVWDIEHSSLDHATSVIDSVTEGRRRATVTSNNSSTIFSSMASPESGKFIVRFVNRDASNNNNILVGLASTHLDIPLYTAPAGIGSTGNVGIIYRFAGGYLYKDGAHNNVQYTAAEANLDNVDYAWDASTGKVWLRVNGTWQDGEGETGGGSDDISGAGSGNVGTLTTGHQYAFAASMWDTTSISIEEVPDAEMPAGYKNFNTSGFPTPSVTTPTDYFNTVLYTANNTDGHEITGVGFAPDMVIIKDRDTVASHAIFDRVRGVSSTANNFMVPNNTDAENSGGYTNTMVSLDSDGFTLDDDSNDQRVNYGGSMVAWCWKAGGTATTTSPAGSLASTSSVAAHGGFSIVSYTGTGSATTVGHGLSRAPGMMIIKQRDDTGNNWIVYHDHNTSAPETDYLILNSNAATADLNTIFNDTAPTATVFSIGTSGHVNEDDHKYMAYCFARTPNAIGIGSYYGNGNADGPRVFVDDGSCGFLPAFVMIKAMDQAESWWIGDNKRTAYQQDNPPLLELNTTAADETGWSGNPPFDFMSNGFKIKRTGGAFNTDGKVYLYIAFAASSFAVNNRPFS